jgi:antitoxin MazE
MEVPMQVSKWGNSLAVRLPAKLVEELGLKEGDEVDVRRAGDGALEIAKTPSADDLFDRLEKFKGRMPANFKFDREDANRRGDD